MLKSPFKLENNLQRICFAFLLLLQNNKNMAAILSVNCQTILVGLCIGLLVYYVTRRLKYRLPPGPWCVPVIGNVQGQYTPVNSGEIGQCISYQQYTVIDCSFGQQILQRVKQNCYCQRNQSITVCYTPSFFSKFSYFLIPYPCFQYPCLLKSGRRFVIVTSISHDILNQ